MDSRGEKNAFEAWFIKKYGHDCFVGSDWEAWKAAKAQAVPEGFVLIEKKLLNEAVDCLDDFGMDCLVDKLTEAQEQK